MLVASCPTILSLIVSPRFGARFGTVMIAKSLLSLKESFMRRCRLVVYSSPAPKPSSAVCSFHLMRL
jgi:hypothetical protein